LRFGPLKQEWVDLLFGFTTRVFFGLAEDFQSESTHTLYVGFYPYLPGAK
jgi:hypothetical protein